MKAVQFQDVDKLALEELDTPSIKDDEVLVALRSVGICHSDFELLEGPKGREASEVKPG